MARNKLLGKSSKQLPGGGRIDWDDRRLVVDINKVMNIRLKKSAEIVADIAVKNVPVGEIKRAAGKFASWKARKPGSLKKSIKVVKSKFRDGGYLVKVGGHDTYYWFFVEYGTSRMAPQWFMRTALMHAKARLRGIF